MAAIARVSTLLLVLLLPFLAHGRSTSSVRELENRMYVSLAGSPCVRWLSLTGELGCGNPRRTLVDAPIRRVEDKLDSPAAVMVPASTFREFIDRVGDDQNVIGVLVENAIGNPGFDVSDDVTFPQAEFAPYENRSWIWNSAGSGILQRQFNFPVFLLSPLPLPERGECVMICHHMKPRTGTHVILGDILACTKTGPSVHWCTVGCTIVPPGLDHKQTNPLSEFKKQESTVLVQKIASENAENGFKRPTSVVEFGDIMQTTKSGTHTSESCLRELSCLPLGGYSVMSTFPAVNVSAPVVKPVVVAMASMDSATFFRDVAPGADSPTSGAIALLAAVDALSHVVDFADLPKRLVFLVFTGEARGYLGSRQFLAQLKNETFVDYGLTASSIQQVLEVGSVGRASQSTFFAHKQATATASPTQQILDSLRLSASATSSTVKLANIANPGIPPSSLMTFVHSDSAIAGVVLEEFDTAFANKYYNSQYDDKRNVNTTAIVAAASLVARTLTILASDNVLAVDSSTLKSIEVNVSVVEEMVECFFGTSPGMRCRLVESLMTASQNVASQYVGVFQADPSLSPNSMPEVIGDTTRFVWNFLADRTALQRKDVPEKCTVVCKNPWEVCVGATQSQIGQCRVSATRYVPAYSPRLRFEEYGWALIPLEADDKMGAADPVYTESYWNSISTRAYLQECSLYEEFILFIGVCVTLISILSSFSSTTFLRKRLKRA